MPDLSALEVLVAVSRKGSFGEAARELGRTQQAVSARVATLEAQTGVPLVTRGPAGSVLTPAGRVIADWASRLLDHAAEVDAGLSAMRSDARARVRVAASLTVAEQLVPRWLVALRAAGSGPDVVVDAVNSAEVAGLVRNGRADVGFVEGPVAPRGCRSQIVAHDELQVVVAPTHPWTLRGRPVEARMLAATPLVTRERGSGTRETLEAALRRALGVDAEIAPPALELSTTAAIRTAVLAGAAPAVLSAMVVAEDLAAGRLRRVPVRGLDLRRALRAVWVGGRTPPAGPARDLVAIAGHR